MKIFIGIVSRSKIFKCCYFKRRINAFSKIAGKYGPQGTCICQKSSNSENCAHVVVCHVWLFATPWTVVLRAPLSMGFLDKNTGVGCHFLPQGSNPYLPHWQADSFTTEPIATKVPADAGDTGDVGLIPGWGRCQFHPWMGKIHWRMKGQPTSLFLPGKSHGQRSLESYSPWGCKETHTTEQAQRKPHRN